MLTSNDKLSIAELQQLGRDLEDARGVHLEARQAELLDAVPMLFEIAVAALTARDAACTCGTNDSDQLCWVRDVGA